MNKQQYKEYRRNQRICYDNEDGFPNSEYFNKIPLQRRPYLPTHQSLVTVWEHCKKEFEYQQRPGTTEVWEKGYVLVGNNNPHASANMRSILPTRYTYY